MVTAGRVARRWAVWGMAGLALIAGPAVQAPWGVAAAQVATREADTPLAPAAEKQVAANAGEAQAGGLVGWLKITGPLREGPVPYAWVSPEDAGPSMEKVLSQLRHVAERADYQGVVIYLDMPELSLTQIETIRGAIRDCRERGKRVLTFAESYGLTSYLLASAGDLILLQHKGDVDLTGLGFEEMYLAGLFEKIGVKADLLQVGRFKGADEPLTRSGPSEAWSQNMESLIDGLYAAVVDPIAERRGMTREAFEAVMRDSWAMTDTQYLERGVVDRLVDRDLIEVTEVEFGERFVWDEHMGQAEPTSLNLDNPFALLRVLFKEPTTKARRSSIAIVGARGPIASGDSQRGEGLFGSDSIGSRTLVEALGDARSDELVKGVIIHLDSPGGSALASEVIWQAVREVQEEKPVYAVIGGMAASGGYYIACATSQIYVAPASIVGSIGVVGGKFVLGGLYEKIGVSVTRRSRGPLGDMFNSVQPFSDEERERVRVSMEKVYDQFTDRVRKGRGERLKDVEQVAEGRLFTGAQAVENGLADRVGDLDDAVAAMARQVGLAEGEYDLIHLPGPLTFSEFMDSLFGVRGRAPQAASPASPTTALAAAAREILGEQAWRQVSMTLGGVMQLRHEPVLCVMPFAIVVR